MYIDIAARLRPFSHTPGYRCLVPYSHIMVEAFPARLNFYALDKIHPALIGSLFWDPPSLPQGFTMQQDLEKGEVRIWEQLPLGLLRFRLQSHGNAAQAVLVVDKVPVEVPFHVEGAMQAPSGSCFSKGMAFYIGQQASDENKREAAVQERLSLGSHKALEWDIVRKRADLCDILPVWFRLGQLVPANMPPADGCGGTFSVLHDFQKALQLQDKGKAFEKLQQLFLAGFDDLLVPRALDVEYQGFALPPLKDSIEGSVLGLLHEGAQGIRSLFIQQEGNKMQVLPLCPSEFICGRFLNIECGCGTLDVEWTKGKMRRAVFKASAAAPLSLAFPAEIKRFRMKEGKSHQGSMVENPLNLQVEANQTYFLDRFEK